MNLTVLDMAERLAPLTPGGDTAAVARQIRHWTMTRVLRPVGTPHPGAGRARWYRPGEVYIAAVITELAAWRIPVGIAESIAEAVRRELEGDAVPTKRPMHFVRDAIEGRAGVTLVVRIPDRSSALNFDVKIGLHDDVVGAVRSGGATSYVVVDLTALFAKVGKRS
jgi:hypothetical protein